MPNYFSYKAQTNTTITIAAKHKQHRFAKLLDFFTIIRSAESLSFKFNDVNIFYHKYLIYLVNKEPIEIGILKSESHLLITSITVFLGKTPYMNMDVEKTGNYVYLNYGTRLHFRLQIILSTILH